MAPPPIMQNMSIMTTSRPWSTKASPHDRPPVCKRISGSATTAMAVLHANRSKIQAKVRFCVAIVQPITNAQPSRNPRDVQKMISPPQAGKKVEIGAADQGQWEPPKPPWIEHGLRHAIRASLRVAAAKAAYRTQPYKPLQRQSTQQGRNALTIIVIL